MIFAISCIVISALVDIYSNVLLKKSDGFRSKKYGFASIACVILAFIILSLSLDTIPLSVAYSTWGAVGIIGTCAAGWFLYNERLNKIGILGVIVVLIAIGFLHA